MKRIWCSILLELVASVAVVPQDARGLAWTDESLIPTSGAVGHPYRNQLGGRAGLPPYTFKMDSGSLPPGLAMSKNGLITGIPTRSGTFQFWGNLADSSGRHSERPIKIVVVEPPGPGSSGSAQWYKPGWTLTFYDEFDRKTLDPCRWSSSSGGNPPLPAAHTIQGGILHLQLDRDPPVQPPDKGPRVSSLETRGSWIPFAQQYGWFEVRARCANGSGVQSTFTLGPMDRAYKKLRADGGTRASTNETVEIDLLKQFGKEPQTANFIVYHGVDPAKLQSDAHRAEFPFALTSDFHVYALEWNAKALVWYLDGKELHRSDRAPHTPFFLRLSVYEGSNPLRGTATNAIPHARELEIDYVRIYSANQ